MKNYYTYVAANKGNTVLYTGVTNDLNRRMFEHKNKLIKGFTSKYNVVKLIWYEEFNLPEEAIAAEKKIKGWTRQKKINLIKELNPNFSDLLVCHLFELFESEDSSESERPEASESKV